VSNELIGISNFIRTFRAKTRFGRRSREPLHLLRLEWEFESVVCEWVARRHDSFDEGLPSEVGERNESAQALEDALVVRDLLFARLPGISTAHLRVYRRSASDSLDLVIAGTLARNDPIPDKTISLAMRAKLIGLRFVLDDGILLSLAEEVFGDIPIRLGRESPARKNTFPQGKAISANGPHSTWNET